MAKIDVTKQIGDQTFQFTHISVRKLNKLFIKISKLIAKPLAAGSSSSSTSFDIMQAITVLAESADETQVDLIIDELLSATMLHGKGMLSMNNNMDELDLKTLWLVVKEAAEVYFGDFLQELLDVAGMDTSMETPTDLQ